MTAEAGRARIATRVLRPTEVRGANASVILRLLIENGPMPRARISRALGLTQGAVTRIVAELSAQGLVREGERLNAATPGRPLVPVDIVPHARLTIGLHIGVHMINAALTDLRGRAVVSRRVAHGGSVENVLQLSTKLIDELEGYADAPVLGVGAISGGWVEPATGMIRRHDLLNWRDVPLRQQLTERTGASVLVETSARAHALADILSGEARGHSSFAHVFVGHVVEASLVLDGRVHTGPDGLGGSLANWTMDDGSGGASSAWKVVGDGAILARARALGILPRGAPFDDLVAVATAGGPGSAVAIELLDRRAFDVGLLIGALTDLVGLTLVIVSSGVVALESSIDHVRAGLESARAGLPVPELRAEANTGETLTRAAASVVLASTVLGGWPGR